MGEYLCLEISDGSRKLKKLKGNLHLILYIYKRKNIRYRILSPL